jgi:hypothetical protein
MGAGTDAVTLGGHDDADEVVVVLNTFDVAGGDNKTEFADREIFPFHNHIQFS